MLVGLLGIILVLLVARGVYLASVQRPESDVVPASATNSAPNVPAPEAKLSVSPSAPKPLAPKTYESPASALSPTPKEQSTAAPSPAPNCISNPSPVFTHHITDITKVRYVGPPPTMGSGPSLKTHSYIGTDHANVPVYAPAAMTLEDGSHYVGGPYMFDFKVSCEVTVRFGHMTNPVDAIKKLLPSEPASDSRTQALAPVSFAAGELVGYTTGTDLAGNWDFGVYNSSVSNRYANDPDWNDSTVYTTAVCPFDYFTPDLKSAYTSKFNSAALGGNPPHGDSFCKP